MTDILDALKHKLEEFDQEIKAISESDVSAAINSLKDPNIKSTYPSQFVAEAMAFDFCEDYHDQITGWGTYYGPMFGYSNGEGWPSIKMVNEEIIRHWIQRANETKHPVLRIRYADLVWDLSKLCVKETPKYTIAQIVIDGVIELAEKNCYSQDRRIVTKFERALSIALSLSDKTRVEKLTNVIMAFEDKSADSWNARLLGFSYDLLYENDKIYLTDPQKLKLISDLEKQLKKAINTSDEKGKDPWTIESIAIRLAKYYRKIGKHEDTKRVILSIGDAFVQATAKASALQSSAWLQSVHATYLEFGLKDEAVAISLLLREVGTRVDSEMKPISHTITVPKEIFDKHISSMIEGNFETALMRITINYIPQKNKVESQVKELAKKAPISYLITKEISDEHGRPVAKIGPLEEDLQGHTIQQLSQNLAIESVILRPVFESLIKKHPTFGDLFIEYIYHSVVFEEDRKTIIELGIKEYLNGNHVIAIHLLVPQIENLLRNTLEKAGGSVLIQANNGSFRLKIFDELLRDPLIIQVFGEDIIFYFKTVFVDSRGWNLRNCVCHGLSNPNELSATVSDRLIHVLLCLALVKEKDRNTTKPIQ
jgi:hypothetical protein